MSSPNFTTMLGARARAAEYNAYKAATARQASREAEEQKLPPKPVPVSLSAFTKNPFPNRNKGNKAWVPLILEDTPEHDRTPSSRHDQDTMSTPTRQTARVFGESVESRPRSLFPPVRELQSVRVNIPDIAAPTARQFNVQTHDHSAPLLNPTPRRIQPHSILQQHYHNPSSSIKSTPGNHAPLSLYPDSNQVWLNGSQSFPITGQVPAYAANPVFSYGPMMVPDDISPAKQENKLAVLSQAYSDAASGLSQTQRPFPGTPDFENTTAFLHYTSNHHRAAPPAWLLTQECTGETECRLHRPAFPNTNSDSLTRTDGEVFNSAPPPMTAIEHHISNLEADSSTFGGPQTIPRPADFTPWRPRPLPVNLSNEEPYDRNRKMQNFVATQLALAKTGKTVLNNPKLHRNKVGDDSTNTPHEQDSSAEVQPANLLHKPLPTLKPPPGLESQQTTRAVFPFDTLAGGVNTPTYEEVREGFDVGSPEWLELRPVTKMERTRMGRMMKLCSRVQDVDSPRILTDEFSASRLKGLYRNVEDSSPGTRLARAAVNQIAKSYLASRISQLTSNGGGISNSESRIAEIESASIGAVGNILVSMKASSELSGNEDDNVGYFSKYKPAPEYAIERGRLLVGNTGNASYFEEETGSFYNAPSRIARDPRFRPASKEGLKGKVNDEWKVRHDLYGRRR